MNRLDEAVLIVVPKPFSIHHRLESCVVRNDFETFCRDHTANIEVVPVSTWVALEDLANIPPLPDPGVATPAAAALPVGDIGV